MTMTTSMEPSADQSSTSNPRRSTRLDRFHAHDHEIGKVDQESDSDSDEDLYPIYEVEIPSDEDEANLRAAYRLPPRTASKLRQIYEASKAEHKRLRARVLGTQRERLQGVLERLERGPRTLRDEVAIERLRAVLGYDVAVHESDEVDGVIGEKAEDVLGGENFDGTGSEVEMRDAEEVDGVDLKAEMRDANEDVDVAGRANVVHGEAEGVKAAQGRVV
ncbi:hypothetical protein LTR78_009241 [Recurvomyces mirabilis]|uniref:Uncharacterized protein n=1 Tax=Recurvomyces mirabilis TaxID=574656 RepID=A0AAE0TRZ9_9PEZI|nr:hypothetical protein LTR78_009241 [Recurvomyces mirabilis]KAK5156198.1 hypothetical protein LTS14_005085 [Recurvomyces mirabilis]